MRPRTQDTYSLRQVPVLLGCGLFATVVVAGCASTCGCLNGVASTGGIYLPPAPPTSNVLRPSGSVTSPNLRVLPWAGFKAAVTYTFDDSQPSQLEHWPELKATGVPMTFFVNPSASTQAGYDFNWKAIGKAGSELGNHTWNHCRANLSSCSPFGTQEDEIDQTTLYIVSHLGVKDVYSFADPFGDTGWRTYAAPRFLTGRGVMSGTVPPTGASDWYNLPVFPVATGQTAKDFNAGIDNARSQGHWNIFMFHSIRPTANDWYAGVEIADITICLDLPGCVC
jgi:Polysaccharide deacetylase